KIEKQIQEDVHRTEELVEAVGPEAEKETKGVKTLLGDPKKAIISLSIPMMISMLLSSSYSFIDGIWISGLGSEALVAIGFVMPLFMILMGVGSGIGSGATAVIGKYIGARDKSMADNAATHAVIITTVISLILTAVLLGFLNPLLSILGVPAGLSMTFATEYAFVMILGTIFFTFANSSYGILRAEGNVTKVTYAMVASTILNIILDPILIYGFGPIQGYGMTGAAIASVISNIFVCVLIVYWFRKNTYLNVGSSVFKYNKGIVNKTLNVGIPASLEMLLISASTIFLNYILLTVDVTGNAVAVYSTSWRVVMMAIIPAIGIGITATSLAAANYGAQKFENIKITQNFSSLFGIATSVIIAIFLFIFAEPVAGILTMSGSSKVLTEPIALLVRMICVYIVISPLGIVATSMLRGLGKGVTSLMLNIIRQIPFVLFFSYLLGIVFNMGVIGVYIGVIVGNVMGNLMVFLYTRHAINFIAKQKSGT
ncbi:MAG: MATE family efflux transporter, partial [Methanobacteriaceae archaeon]